VCYNEIRRIRKMKISQALQAQKAISAEVSHLRGLEQQKAWSYRSLETPDAEMKPNFDFEKNHEMVKKLSRLHTKLGQAIARTNLEVNLVGLDEKDVQELEEWV
jgi:DNA topoisomerase IA